MARLNNLLVTGVSRFLNKIKSPKVETDDIESTNGKINTLKTKTISAYYGTQSGIDQFSTGSSGQVLTSDGVTAKWQNISTDSITSGILPVSRGGTGKTTGADAANYFINSLEIGSDTPVDNDYYVAQYVNGGTTTTSYHRRPISKLWYYIKGKISSWAKNNTTKGALGWSSSSNDTMPITSNTLAYWNGAYQNTTSNLEYVKKGTLGDACIKAVDTSITLNSTSVNLPTSKAISDFVNDNVITKIGGTINGSLTINNQLDTDSINAGNLVVTGDATFSNDLRGNLIGTVNGKSCSLTMAMDTTDTKQVNISFI